jgi:hypothetical protein
MLKIWILLKTMPACSWILTPDQGVKSNVVVPLDKLTGSDKPYKVSYSRLKQHRCPRNTVN